MEVLRRWCNKIVYLRTHLATYKQLRAEIEKDNKNPDTAFERFVQEKRAGTILGEDE
jgi:hypothetical protein